VIPETNIRDGHRLVDRVHSYLRKAILSGELRPGTRVVETELAKKLGVSRSPVREAVSQLEQENLVVISGLRVMVGEVSPAEVDDLLWIRCALEGLAARLATQKLELKDLQTMRGLCGAMRTASERDDYDTISRLGNEFHDVFIHACGNQRLHKMVADAKDYVVRFRSISAASPGRGSVTVREHLAILEAFEARDPDRAEREVRSHIDGARRALASGVAEATT
jgi:DNA-binding GntR family transcriptional regulator